MLDLCAFATLVERLGFETARLTWPQVRDDVRSHWEAGRLDVVIDLKRKRAVLAGDDAGIGAVARSGNLLQVVDLAHAVASAREDFRNALVILNETEPAPPDLD